MKRQKFLTLSDQKVPKGGLLNKGLRTPPTIKHLKASKIAGQLKMSNFKNVMY